MTTTGHQHLYGSLAGVLAGGIAIAVGLIGAPFSGGLSLAAVVAGIKLAGTAIVVGVGSGLAASYISKQVMPNDFYLPLYRISPEEIFSNEVLLFDVNFFNPKEEKTETLTTGQEITQESSAQLLQSTISQWYFTLRNFAIVALLSILVYTGIRIIISSSAQDKAKYKQRLMDWTVSMCLLFFLHYIMAFAITITELITDSLNKTIPSYIAMFDNETLQDYHWDFDQVIYKKYYNDQEITDDEIKEKGLSESDIEKRKESVKIDSKVLEEEKDGIYEMLKESYIINEDEESGAKYLAWPTNLMGKARIDAQMEIDGKGGDNTLISQFGNTMIFLTLVIYTILFVFRYLNRLLMLAFLTIIAPFVAMTYPLDKMNDGSAQAFNMWLKEYIYNLLIQPVHLILYTVLIGSAFVFASNNLLFALAALGFILQAEKIIRKFFGFEKASTLAGGSALGGAMAMQGINMLRRIGGGKGKQKGGGKSGKGEGQENDRVRFSDRKPDEGRDIDSLLDGGGNDRANGSLPLSGSNEGQRAAGNRQAGRELLNEATNDDERRMVREMMAQDKESDTRGIGQWISDSYQGSRLQSGLHNAGQAFANSRPIRFTRRVGGGIASGARSVRDLAGRGVRAIPKPIRNTIRGATSVVGKGLGKAGMAAIRKAPDIGKMALKGTVAGAALMAGSAAGLGSESFGNVGKWGATAAASGFIGAEGAISKATGMMDSASDAVGRGIESAASTYTISAHGYEAEEERQKRQADKAAMRDKNRQELYARKLKLAEKKQIEQVMREAQEYREAGITDDDLIIKAMKSKDFEGDRASEERIIAASLAKEVKKQSGSEDQKMKVAIKTMEEHNLSQADIDRYDKGIRKLIR